jgi:excisionase family DNA binding protein
LSKQNSNRTQCDVPQDQLLRAEDISQVLNCGRTMAYNMMANNTLPVVRLGRSVRVPASALMAWIRDNAK